jgi:hypothetical protein
VWRGSGLGRTCHRGHDCAEYITYPPPSRTRWTCGSRGKAIDPALTCLGTAAIGSDVGVTRWSAPLLPLSTHWQAAGPATVGAYLRRLYAQYQDSLARGVLPVSESHRSIAEYRKVWCAVCGPGWGEVTVLLFGNFIRYPTWEGSAMARITHHPSSAAAAGAVAVVLSKHPPSRRILHASFVGAVSSRVRTHAYNRTVRV